MADLWGTVTCHVFQPLSWPSLVLLVITGGGLVAYYDYIKREKKSKSAQSQHADCSWWLRGELVLLVCFLVAGASTVTTAGQAALGGSWCLVDANGNVVTDVDLR